MLKCQSSGAGGTRSPPATSHRLQNPKWPQNGQRGLERYARLGFWALRSTFTKKVFDSRTPSLRKGCEEERKKGGKTNVGKRTKRMMNIVATYVIASQTDWNPNRSCQNCEIKIQGIFAQKRVKKIIIHLNAKR